MIAIATATVTVADMPVLLFLHGLPYHSMLSLK
jgi:hypothetical protein